MNRVDLERLINKPRAFRHHCMVDPKKSLLAAEIPLRLTMIFLGSEVVSNRETPRNYHKIRSSHRKIIK